MPSLYVANPTNQRQVVCYRLDYDKNGDLEANRKFQPARQQEIAPGAQVMLHSRDLHMSQIADIVDQLKRYGGVMTEDVKNSRLAKRKIAYVMNVGLVVPPDVVRRVVFHNSSVMIEEGRERRAKAAVATNEIVQNTVQNQLLEKGIDVEPPVGTEVTYEQMEDPDNEEAPKIAEGFEIVPEGQPGRKTGKVADVPKRGRGRPRGS